MEQPGLVMKFLTVLGAPLKEAATKYPTLVAPTMRAIGSYQMPPQQSRCPTDWPKPMTRASMVDEEVRCFVH